MQQADQPGDTMDVDEEVSFFSPVGLLIKFVTFFYVRFFYAAPKMELDSDAEEAEPSVIQPSIAMPSSVKVFFEIFSAVMLHPSFHTSANCR